jgi:hypothetical protein
VRNFQQNHFPSVYWHFLFEKMLNANRISRWWWCSRFWHHPRGVRWRRHASSKCWHNWQVYMAPKLRNRHLHSYCSENVNSQIVPMLSSVKFSVAHCFYVYNCSFLIFSTCMCSILGKSYLMYCVSNVPCFKRKRTVLQFAMWYVVSLGNYYCNV